jgi:hypothetical protein
MEAETDSEALDINSSLTYRIVLEDFTAEKIIPMQNSKRVPLKEVTGVTYVVLFASVSDVLQLIVPGARITEAQPIYLGTAGVWNAAQRWISSATAGTRGPSEPTQRHTC